MESLSEKHTDKLQYKVSKTKTKEYKFILINNKHLVLVLLKQEPGLTEFSYFN